MKPKLKRSAVLQADLTKTDERIAGMRPVLDAKAKELAAANSAFLKNEIKFEALLTAKNSHSLIAESIETLSASRERLEREIEAALSVENHQESVNALCSLATLRRTTFDRCTETRKAFDDAATSLLTSKADFDQTRTDFISHMHKLVPGFDAGTYPIIKPNQREQLDAVMSGLERAGLYREDIDFVLLRPQFPKLEHAYLIETAEIYQERARAAERERERLARKDKIQAQQAEARAAEAQRLEEKQRELAVKQQIRNPLQRV